MSVFDIQLQNFQGWNPFQIFEMVIWKNRCLRKFILYIFSPTYTLNQWVNTSMSVEIFLNLSTIFSYYWWATAYSPNAFTKAQSRISNLYDFFNWWNFVMTKKRVHCSNCWRNLWEFVKLFGELFKNLENFTWNL